MKLHRFVGPTAVAIALLVPAGASAATIDVSTTADDYNTGASCSLREAVTSANVDGGFGGCAPVGLFNADPDQINLPPGMYGLSQAGAETDVQFVNDFEDLDVTDDVIIANTGGARAIIDGGGLSRVFDLGATSQAVTLSGLTVQNGKETFGAGIRNVGSKVTIENTTISGNEATAGVGGGIYSAGASPQLTMENDTVSGNKTNAQGGGVAIGGGSTLLRAVTITENLADSDATGTSGGGLVTDDGGGLYNGSPITIQGTLIAGNTDGSPGAEAPDCDDTAAVVSGANNLIGTTTGCDFAPGSSDIVNTDAKLGPLADNGGDSFTHALLAGSPAINKGSTLAPATDQRGFPRQGQPDIGAYERLACAGRDATAIGTAAKDRITGTSAADVIVGLGGNDVLLGLGGKDTICGGAGKDKLRGGAGGDTLRGEAGKDKLFGQAGRDKLLGGPGADLLRGGPGRDKLKGGPGRDKQQQ